MVVKAFNKERKMSKLTLKEFGYRVLQDSQVPMTDIEIWEYGVERGWDKELAKVGKTPWQSLYDMLSGYKNPDNRIAYVDTKPRRKFLLTAHVNTDDKIKTVCSPEEMRKLALNHLGGLKSTHKILKAAKLYELNNGDKIRLRTSRFLSDKQFERYCFYGEQESIVADIGRIDYLVLVRSNEGYYKLPWSLVCELCKNTLFTDNNADYKGYKITIAFSDNVWRLVRCRNAPLIEIEDYFTPFNTSNVTDAIVFPDELPDDSQEYIEGKKKSVLVNIYERDPKARQACIDAYGAVCYICDFDFGKVYGMEFDGKIHVHHLKMICECNGEYVVDPINDLRHVCPNCHMILHSKGDGVYTIEEVKAMLIKFREVIKC
jgi:hypothetical protein